MIPSMHTARLSSPHFSIGQGNKELHIHAHLSQQVRASVQDVAVWSNPVAAVPILGVGTAIYYHCHLLDCPLVSLVADTLLVLTCSIGTLGFLSARFKCIVPLNARNLELSPETAESVVAFFANLFGAAEGVLRVAASGSDDRLFIKVVTFLYSASLVGKLAAGPTVAYVVLWLIFILPYACSRLFPETSCGSNARWCAKKSNKSGRLD